MLTQFQKLSLEFALLKNKCYLCTNKIQTKNNKKMEVQVKVTEILEPQTFLGKDGITNYTRYSFVGTTFGDYPRVIYFQTLGQDKYAQMNIQLNGIYTISFDIESRKYNDKYFTSINAWKAVRETEQNIGQSAPQPNAAYQQAPMPQTQYPSYAQAPQPIAQPPYDSNTPF